MDSEHIHRLLEKYWKCETTLEEEEQLRRYFQQSDPPETLRDIAPLFQHLQESRQTEIVDPTFTKKVLGKLATRNKATQRWLYNTMRIAAGVLVLVLAVWLIRIEVRKNDPSPTADTYSDPEIAFEETKKALLMISKSFGRAEEQARKLNLFNEAQEKVRQDDEPNEPDTRM